MLGVYWHPSPVRPSRTPTRPSHTRCAEAMHTAAALHRADAKNKVEAVQQLMMGHPQHGILGSSGQTPYDRRCLAPGKVHPIVHCQCRSDLNSC